MATKIHRYMATKIHRYIDTSIHTHVDTQIHAYVCMTVHTYMQGHRRLPSHMHKKHGLRGSSDFGSGLHKYIDAQMHKYIHTCVDTHIHAYICMTVRGYIQIHRRIRSHMHDTIACAAAPHLRLILRRGACAFRRRAGGSPAAAAGAASLHTYIHTHTPIQAYTHVVHTCIHAYNDSCVHTHTCLCHAYHIYRMYCEYHAIPHLPYTRANMYKYEYVDTYIYTHIHVSCCNPCAPGQHLAQAYAPSPLPPPTSRPSSWKLA